MLVKEKVEYILLLPVGRTARQRWTCCYNYLWCNWKFTIRWTHSAATTGSDIFSSFLL